MENKKQQKDGPVEFSIEMLYTEEGRRLLNPDNKQTYADALEDPAYIKERMKQWPSLQQNNDWSNPLGSYADRMLDMTKIHEDLNASFAESDAKNAAKENREIEITKCIKKLVEPEKWSWSWIQAQWWFVIGLSLFSSFAGGIFCTLGTYYLTTISK